MGDLAPLVVVRPAGDLQAHRTGQVIGGAQVVHVVVQADLVPVLNQVARAGFHPGDIHAQPVVAVHIAIIQAVDLMLHQRLEGGAGVVHHELLHHGAEAGYQAAGGLVAAAVAAAAGRFSTVSGGGIATKATGMAGLALT